MLGTRIHHGFRAVRHRGSVAILHTPSCRCRIDCEPADNSAYTHRQVARACACARARARARARLSTQPAQGIFQPPIDNIATFPG